MSLFTPKIIRKIAKANLIGRGCNNFPVAKKWLAVRQAQGKEKYVIANVSESEPGVFKDRYILERWPEKVVAGIKIALETIGAKKGFIYLNPEYYEQFYDYLQAIVEGEKVNIELYQKPLPDYIGGEETAVLNSMAGQRVEPKLKPPYPTRQGFFNCPTLINNCETFYAVSLINDGEYKNTRFYCLSGADVGGEIKYDSPVTGKTKGEVKELPIGLTIKQVLEKFGHKPSAKYFYQVGGGAAGECLNHKQLNRAFDSLASIVIYETQTPEKEVVMNWLDFFSRESCGQCVPCREGVFRLREILEKHYLTNERFDQLLVDDLINVLTKTSFCPLGRVAPAALESYWKNVRK